MMYTTDILDALDSHAQICAWERAARPASDFAAIPVPRTYNGTRRGWIAPPSGLQDIPLFPAEREVWADMYAQAARARAVQLRAASPLRRGEAIAALMARLM